MCFSFSVPIVSLFFLRHSVHLSTVTFLVQMCSGAGLECSRCLCSHIWYQEGLAEGWAQLSPSATLCILSSRAFYSLSRRRPSRAIVPKDGRWELQLLGPGPRNEHRCLDSRGGDIDPTFPGRSVREVAAVCNPPGASLSSSKTG